MAALPIVQDLAAIARAEFFPKRYRPGGAGSWSGHLPFANDLIRSTRPSLLVELGTHYGESYFGFCQSVVESGTDTVCYAVDHWRGEHQAGFYDNDVYEEVLAYNERHYQSFSYLLRCSFDDALAHFGDESIDLLHIDGLHTYEAGAHDFAVWLPKVKAGGIILLHDIMTRRSDFGIWKLWAEIEQQFETFAFHHGWGLGVVRKPGGSTPATGLPNLLFHSGAETAQGIRRHYVLSAAAIQNVVEAEAALIPATKDFVQVFPHAGGYSESTSQTVPVMLGVHQTIAFRFDAGLGDGPLRIDICEARGVVRISRIAVTSNDTGKTLWSLDDPAQIAALRAAGSVLSLPAQQEAFFVSLAADPQLFLDDLPDSVRNAPAEVGMTISVVADPTPFTEAFRKTTADLDQLRDQVQLLDSTTANLHEELNAVRAELSRGQVESVHLHAHCEQLQAERDWLKAERDGLKAERDRLKAERDRLKAEHDGLNAERDGLKAEYDRLNTELGNSRSEIDRLTRELGPLRQALAATQRAHDDLQLLCHSEQGRRTALEASLSWRITAPLRSVATILTRRFFRT